MKNIIFENFPQTRLRRNRQNQQIRNLVAETSISVNNLILPLFVCEGIKIKQKISTLPQIFCYSIDSLIIEIEKAVKLGINAIMLFPKIESALKDKIGSESFNENNLICRATTKISQLFPNLIIICDIALDPYSTSVHDGIINPENNLVLNDETIEILQKQALVQAQSGCNFLAPSDMMDGRIGEIRKYLDKNGFKNVGLISYAAKYASNFYGPFRDAVGSKANLNGDKKNYQMNFCNKKEALREIALDISEGADSIIIKPALPYLDIINSAAENFLSPIFAYQVSGEYAMLYFAAKNNAFNFYHAYYESLIAIKRAGANAIITYGAIEMAKFIKKLT